MNEKELLSNAALWYKQEYGHTPKKYGIKFIDIWHKPTFFRKLKTVVFAPTEEIGKAFILEQNLILRSMKCFCISPIVFLAFGFTALHELNQENKETAIAIAIIFTVLCLCALLYFLLLARKCKKLEKIHRWNVDIYCPSR